jgi:hypothetical protein
MTKCMPVARRLPGRGGVSGIVSVPRRLNHRFLLTPTIFLNPSSAAFIGQFQTRLFSVHDSLPSQQDTG